MIDYYCTSQDWWMIMMEYLVWASFPTEDTVREVNFFLHLGAFRFFCGPRKIFDACVVFVCQGAFRSHLRRTCSTCSCVMLLSKKVGLQQRLLQTYLKLLGKNKCGCLSVLAFLISTTSNGYFDQIKPFSHSICYFLYQIKLT